MKKLFIRLLVAFAAFSFGLVLTSLVRPRHTCKQSVTILSAVPLTDFTLSEDEAQIRDIYRDYGPAQTRKDREFFERVETDDFMLIVGNLKMSRDEDIKWMESEPADKTYTIKLDHLKIFDRLAVAHGYLEIRESGGLVQWPFVDGWVKRDGAWRIKSTVAR